MKAVQFVLFLRFAERKRTYSLADRVLESLGGQIPRQDTTGIKEAIGLRINEDRASVQWNSTSCLITVEKLSDKESAINLMASLLDKIDKVAPIERINMRRFSVNWILPAPKYDFASLERLYRSTMIAQNVISDKVIDSCIIFDTKAGKWTLHHQSGAMDSTQLVREYLRFKLEDVPESFLFLETSIIDKNVVKYLRSDMVEFMRFSHDKCVSHSKLFEKVWEGRL